VLLCVPIAIGTQRSTEDFIQNEISSLLIYEDKNI